MKAICLGLGLAVFCIGLSCLVGYVVEATPLYQWNTRGVPMAINTGIAFVLTGTAICILASRARFNNHHDSIT